MVAYAKEHFDEELAQHIWVDSKRIQEWCQRKADIENTIKKLLSKDGKVHLSP